VGLFDIISFPCPQCGEKLVLQSEAADCPYLQYYTFDDAPPAVIGDLDGREGVCNCGSEYRIKVHQVTEVLKRS